MPLTNFTANTVISSDDVDANFALCVLTDTVRTVTVSHTWSASQTFTGGFTTGAAVTLGGNLLFTDATYDIGQSGATRPRHLFMSGNATIGGAATVSGLLTASSGLTVSGATTLGSVSSSTVAIASTVQVALSVTSTSAATVPTLDNTNASSRGAGWQFLQGGVTRGYVGVSGAYLGTTASNVALASYTGPLEFYTNGSVTAAVSIATSNIATFAAGIVVTTGGLTVTAGGLTVTAGGVSTTILTGTGLIQTTVTTQQLALRYDASNHLAVTVASDGGTTVTATGTAATIGLRAPAITLGASGGTMALTTGDTAGTPKIGFLGAPAVERPSISGSRGGIAALADLLTEGATLGLWVDNTSA